MKGKVRIKSIYTYEEHERANKLIRDNFFTNSNFIEMHNLKLIYLNEQIIGSFSCIFHEDNMVEVNHFSIDVGFRKKGLGSKSLSKIKDYFKYKNNKGLVFNCHAELQKFYVKNGFSLELVKDDLYKCEYIF